MALPQYWAVCINDGLIGFACAHYFDEAMQIANLMIAILNVPPLQTIVIYPIGPRLFTKEKIETGDC